MLRSIIGSAIFYIGCIGIAIAMWKLAVYSNSTPFVAATADPAAAYARALDAYANLSSYLTSLSTGLLAALGLFVTSRSKQRFGAQELWPAAVSGVFGCVALYWGFISSQNIEWAIENSIETLDIGELQLPRQLQCLAILLGVVFFADFLRRDLTRRD